MVGGHGKWIHVTEDRDWQQALVDVVMMLWVLKRWGIS